MPPPRASGFLILLLILAGAAGLLLLTAGAAAAAIPGASPAAWRWPAPGELVRRFSYSRAHAFAAGAHRGIDLAAVPGARVGAACGGRVTFAGWVPSGGRGVSVRCGTLVATHIGLGRVAVRRGAVVLPGSRLGEVGAEGRLRLGARRAADRFGYVDPLALLRDAPPGGPVPAAPLGRAPRAPGAPAVPAPARAPVRVAPVTRQPVEPVPSTAPAGIPGAAWAGLVLLAAGLPIGGLVHRDCRRRVRRAPAPGPAASSPAPSRL
jgi:hypothetical protein